MDEWDVLIKDHHAAYITWDEFERNLKAIANNATGMSSALTRGAAREGELLLAGLLRCGHCGRKFHVHYGGKLGRYNCYGACINHSTERCISRRRAIQQGDDARPKRVHPPLPDPCLAIGLPPHPLLRLPHLSNPRQQYRAYP
jgi:hypothetical protein